MASAAASAAGFSHKKKLTKSKSSSDRKPLTVESLKKTAQKMGIPLSCDGKAKTRAQLMAAINYRKKHGATKQAAAPKKKATVKKPKKKKPTKRK